MCGSFALYLDLKMQAPERLIDWQFNDLGLFVGSFGAFRRAVANLRAHLQIIVVDTRTRVWPPS